MSNEISYFDGNQSGEIVSRLSSDCQIIGNSATVNLNEGSELWKFHEKISRKYYSSRRFSHIAFSDEFQT